MARKANRDGAHRADAPDDGTGDDGTQGDGQLCPEFRPRHYQVEDRSDLEVLFDAEGYPVIQFDPVPRQRVRRHGWDEARQRAFIAMLARIPSVGHAARAVGLSPRSAYKLVDCPGAEQFAKAWDMAIEFGLDRVRGTTFARCMEGGDFVPVYRKGRLMRVEWRHNDRLAIALLSGKPKDIDHYRRRAQSRWSMAQSWRAMDAEKGDRLLAEARAREQAAGAVERIADLLGPDPARPPRRPRVRSL